MAMQASELIVRDTARSLGRKRFVSPDNSPLRELSYGRIRLDATLHRVAFASELEEVGLICLSGTCSVKVGDEAHALRPGDGIYVPRDSLVEVQSAGTCDLVELSARVAGRYPVQVVRAREAENDPSLFFSAGGSAAERELRVVFGKNIQAGKIMAGITRSKPGNWTSWPPHEHGKMLEEAYVYFDMPSPAFGIQFVYTSDASPECITMVRDGDVVCMPEGYHPNVAIPGHTINFVWLMAAREEVSDRRFGVVNVHPAFAQGGSGLEKGAR